MSFSIHHPIICETCHGSGSCQPLTVEAQVQFQTSPCGIIGEQCGTGTGFPTNTSVFLCQYHSTNGPYSYTHLALTPHLLLGTRSIHTTNEKGICFKSKLKPNWHIICSYICSWRMQKTQLKCKWENNKKTEAGHLRQCVPNVTPQRSALLHCIREGVGLNLSLQGSHHDLGVLRAFSIHSGRYSRVPFYDEVTFWNIWL